MKILSKFTQIDKKLIFFLQFFKGSPALGRNYYLNTSSEEYTGYIAAYRALLKETVTALSGEAPVNTTHIDDLIAFEVRFAAVSIPKIGYES